MLIFHKTENTVYVMLSNSVGKMFNLTFKLFEARGKSKRNTGIVLGWRLKRGKKSMNYV